MIGVARVLAFAAGVVALIVAVILAFTPKCNADPVDDRNHDAALFCRDLDQDSSINGVYLAFGKPLQQGIEPNRIIDTTNYALNFICPEYKPAVDRAIAAASKKDWGPFAT